MTVLGSVQRLGEWRCRPREPREHVQRGSENGGGSAGGGAGPEGAPDEQRLGLDEEE